jgi:hypothetical protein
MELGVALLLDLLTTYITQSTQTWFLCFSFFDQIPLDSGKSERLVGTASSQMSLFWNAWSAAREWAQHR